MNFSGTDGLRLDSSMTGVPGTIFIPARGMQTVLTTITASRLESDEVYEIVDVVRNSTAEDVQYFVFYPVQDEDMGDGLRVTILAGLGEAVRPDEGSKDGKEQA
jgi:cell division GTPase FtsZ